MDEVKEAVMRHLNTQAGLSGTQLARMTGYVRSEVEDALRDLEAAGTAVRDRDSDGVRIWWKAV